MELLKQALPLLIWSKNTSLRGLLYALLLLHAENLADPDFYPTKPTLTSICVVFFFPQVLSRGRHSLQQGGTSLLCGVPNRWVLDALRWASERQLDLIEQTTRAAASVLPGVCALSWKMTRGGVLSFPRGFHSIQDGSHLFIQFVSAFKWVTWGMSVVGWNGNQQIKLCLGIRQKTGNASSQSLWILLLSSCPCLLT